MKNKYIILAGIFCLLLSTSCRTYHCRLIPQQNPELSQVTPAPPVQSAPKTFIERKKEVALAFVQKTLQDTNLQKGLPIVKHLLKLKQNPRIQAKLDRLSKQLSDSSEGENDIFSEQNVKWLSIGSLIAMPAGIIINLIATAASLASFATIITGIAGVLAFLGLLAAIIAFVVVKKHKGKYTKNTELLAKLAFWLHMALIILAAVLVLLFVVLLAGLANNGNC